jgi:GGDEF domain-containing protein
MLRPAEHVNLAGQRHLMNAIKDITKRNEMEEEIKRLAYHDVLTGLPNRMLLRDRLAQAMYEAKETGRNRYYPYYGKEHRTDEVDINP